MDNAEAWNLSLTRRAGTCVSARADALRAAPNHFQGWSGSCMSSFNAKISDSILPRATKTKSVLDIITPQRLGRTNLPREDGTRRDKAGEAIFARQKWLPDALQCHLGCPLGYRPGSHYRDQHHQRTCIRPHLDR